MGVLDNLGPGQRQILFIGVPVVAALAVTTRLGKSKQSGETSVAPTGYVLPAAPSTDVVGVGQLSEFESMVTGAINAVSYDVSELTTAIGGLPKPPPAKQLRTITSSAYPIVAVPDTAFEILGSIGANGYEGLQVSGGAPVYAYDAGQWRQNFDINKLAKGTPLATPSTFEEYIQTGS